MGGRCAPVWVADLLRNRRSASPGKTAEIDGIGNKYSPHKSATTDRAGGMRKAPGRGRIQALLVIADLSQVAWTQRSDTH